MSARVRGRGVGVEIGPGSQLKHYRLQSKLGEGGMGVVWKATDTRLDREVALKILPPEMAGDPERLTRFERESKAIAALNHPNIVTIHAVEQEQETRFIAMEYLQGRPLADVIPSNGMRVDQFLDVAIPMADAVSAAHSNGITHRDLKPANVMVGQDGRTKILDFGLAKRAEIGSDMAQSQAPTMALTQMGKLLGTVPYMSPEQVKGQDIDHRTDIFSLGTICYEMVTGELPFRGNNSADMISSILRDRPANIRESNPSMPPQLDRLISRCLEKEPERRYQNAEEFREELGDLQRRLVSGEISIDSSLTVPIAEPPAPRRKWLIPGLAVVGVVGIAAAIFGLGRMFGRDSVAEPAPQPAVAAMPAVAAANTATPSIAVLPFANLSNDQENEYFSDGLTEELINTLSQVDGLRVAARSSTFALKDRGLTVQEIGQQLGVTHVIDGSVRRAGDRIRLTAQLASVADGFPVWNETFDREIADVFAVQEEIARSIADNLEVQLVEDDADSMARTGTEDAEAFNLYLQGRHAWNRRTEEGIRSAMTLFEKAVERDPNFALAYAGLADSYVVLPGYTEADVDESFEKANEFATMALEMEPTLAEALTSRAAYLMRQGEVEKSDELFRAALQQNPNYATAHHWYALLLRGNERIDEAVHHLEMAEQLDPLSGVVRKSLADLLNDLGRDDEAFARLEAIQSIDPSFPVHTSLARGYYWRRDFPRCEKVYENAGGMAGLDYQDLDFLASCLYYQRKYDQALDVAKQAEDLDDSAWATVRMLSRGYLGIGKPDRVLRLVDKNFDRHLPLDPQDANEILQVVHDLRVHGHFDESVVLAQSLYDRWTAMSPEDRRRAPIMAMIANGMPYFLGKKLEAFEGFDQFGQYSAENPDMLDAETFLGISGSLAAAAGKADIAKQRITSLRRLDIPRNEAIKLYWEAAIATGLGEHDRGLKLLSQAYDEGFHDAYAIFEVPFFEPLYEKKGFLDLLDRLNMPHPVTQAGRTS